MNVEYHRLRPRSLVARRQAMPVAYLGLGILEWHGLHNPLGLDGVKANGIAVHLATALGGVVMPPLFWGDNRSDICELVFDPAVSPWLPEGTTDHTAAIFDAMALPKKAFQEDAARSIAEGGWRLWKELIVHNLNQIQTFGFKLIILIPGHYPLFGPLDDAVAEYKDRGGATEVHVLTDHMYDETGKAGDHAAAFETSAMLALEPNLVDLNELDPDPGTPPTGVLGDDPRSHASKAFGDSILERFTELVRKRISDM
jgi:creatinine amidohydrolase